MQLLCLGSLRAAGGGAGGAVRLTRTCKHVSPRALRASAGPGVPLALQLPKSTGCTNQPPAAARGGGGGAPGTCYRREHRPRITAPVVEATAAAGARKISAWMHTSARQTGTRSAQSVSKTQLDCTRNPNA